MLAPRNMPAVISSLLCARFTSSLIAIGLLPSYAMIPLLAISHQLLVKAHMQGPPPPPCFRRRATFATYDGIVPRRMTMTARTNREVGTYRVINQFDTPMACAGIYVR